MMSKNDLFDLFFGSSDPQGAGVGIPSSAAEFMEAVRQPRPSWRGVCSVTAVGIEDLIDERLLVNDEMQVDWDKAMPLRAEIPASQDHSVDLDEKVAAEGPPRCAGIPLEEWSAALEFVARLQDAEKLSMTEAAEAKKRLRALDAGFLLTIMAFARFGEERLAKELREAVHAALTE